MKKQSMISTFNTILRHKLEEIWRIKSKTENHASNRINDMSDY